MRRATHDCGHLGKFPAGPSRLLRLGTEGVRQIHQLGNQAKKKLLRP